MKKLISSTQDLSGLICKPGVLFKINGKYWNLSHLLHIDVDTDPLQPVLTFVDGSSVSHVKTTVGLVGDLVAGGYLMIRRAGAQDPVEFVDPVFDLLPTALGAHNDTLSTLTINGVDFDCGSTNPPLLDFNTYAHPVMYVRDSNGFFAPDGSTTGISLSGTGISVLIAFEGPEIVTLSTQNNSANPDSNDAFDIDHAALGGDVLGSRSFTDVSDSFLNRIAFTWDEVTQELQMWKNGTKETVVTGVTGTLPSSVFPFVGNGWGATGNAKVARLQIFDEVIPDLQVDSFMTTYE